MFIGIAFAVFSQTAGKQNKQIKKITKSFVILQVKVHGKCLMKVLGESFVDNHSL